MDIRQLKYFVQIVESGSLSKASRQLFIVQPALSQQISRLEDEVGKPLLIRSVRGVEPTENGEALYHHAKFILRQIDEAVQVARQQYSAVQGRVVLGLSPSTSAMVGLTIIRQLKEKHPKLLLNVVVALPAQLEDMARKGELDVAILFSDVAANELTHEPLFDEEVFVVIPSDSSLVPAHKTALTLAEVAALPLVLSSPQHNLRRRLSLEFERANLKPNLVAEIDSLQLVMRHVLEDGGATIQAVAATGTVGSHDDWRWLPISDVPIHRASYLYSQPIQRLSVGAAVVRTELKQLVFRLIDAGIWEGVKPITQE